MNRHNMTLRPLNTFKTKPCYSEVTSTNDEEHDLKNREQQSNQIKRYTSKLSNIVENEVGSKSQLYGKEVILLDSNVHLAGALLNKNKKHKRQISQITSRSKDRLIIELSDYLALTKTKNIVKFKLKPIIPCKSDKKTLLSPVKDITKSTNTVQLNHSFKGEQLSRLELVDSGEEPQRSFLLVPEDKANSISKQSKLDSKLETGKKSKALFTSALYRPVETLHKVAQNGHSKSNNQLSNIQKNSENSHKKIIDAQRLKIQSLVRVNKQFESNNQLLDKNIDNNAWTQKKKKSNVVVKLHPFLAQTRSLLKHKSSVTKNTKHQSYPIISQEKNSLNLKINLNSISNNNVFIDEIKCETFKQDLDFVISQKSENTNKIFPVALKISDSDKFEYFRFEDNNEISTDTEMQILGI